MRRQVCGSWEARITRRRSGVPDASWSRPGSAHSEAPFSIRPPSPWTCPGQRTATEESGPGPPPKGPVPGTLRRRTMDGDKALNAGRPPRAEAPGSKTRPTRNPVFHPRDGHSGIATATPSLRRFTKPGRSHRGPWPDPRKDRLARETRPSPTAGSAFRGRSPGPLPPSSALGLAGARGAGSASGRRFPATEATPEGPARAAPQTAASTLLRALGIVRSNKRAFNKIFSLLLSFLCIKFLYLHNLSTSYSHADKQ